PRGELPMTTSPHSIETPLLAIGLLWVVLVAIAALVIPTRASAADGVGTMSLTFTEAGGALVTGACIELYTQDYANLLTSTCATAPIAVVRQLPAGGYVVHETQPPSAQGKVFRKADDRELTVLGNSTTNVALSHERGAKVTATAVLPTGISAGFSCFSA